MLTASISLFGGYVASGVRKIMSLNPDCEAAIFFASK
jgi:hypothetical protein